MAKKSKFIKNLLTTASAAAMLVAGTQSAFAATRTTTANPAFIGGNNNIAANGINAKWQNGDDLQIAAVGHIDIRTNGDVVFGNANNGIDENGQGGAHVFTILHNVTYAKANTFAGVNAGLDGLVVNQAGVVATFAKGVKAGIVTVTAGTLNVGAKIIAGGNNGGAGDLVVNGKNGIANITGLVTNDVTISNGQATLGNNVGNDVNQTGGVLNVAGLVTNDFTISKGTATVTGNVGNDVGQTGGKLTVASVTGNVVVNGNKAVFKTTAGNVGGTFTVGAKGGDATVTGDVVGNITSKGGNLTVTGDVAAVSFTTKNGGTVRVNGDVAGAVNFNGKASTLILGDGSDLQGNVISGGAGKGTVIAIKDTTLTGKIGNAASISEFQINDGVVDVQNTVYKANTFNFVDDGTLQFNNGPQTLTGNIISTGGGAKGQGTLELNSNHAREVIGNVGSAADPLRLLNFKANNTFTFRGAKAHFVSVENDGAGGVGNAKGKLTVRGAGAGDQNFDLRFSSGNDKWLSELNILGSKGGKATIVSFTGEARAAKVDLANGQNNVLSLQPNAIVRTTNFNFNDSKQELRLGKGSKVFGAINSKGAGGARGIISVLGNSRIEGAVIGTNANANTLLHSLSFDANKSTLTVKATGAHQLATKNGIIFNHDKTSLLFTGNQNHTVTSPVVIGKGGSKAGFGEIEFGGTIGAKNLAIVGKVGKYANDKLGLRLLSNNSNSNLTLTSPNAHIRTYHFQNNKALILNKANGKYRIGRFESANGAGTLQIGDDILIRTDNLVEGSKHFDQTRIQNIDIAGGNHTVTIDDGSVLRSANLRATNVNQGKLVFLGNALFDAPTTTLIGGKNQTVLDSIDIGAGGAAGKTVDFRSTLHVNNNINFSKDSTFRFSGGLLQSANGKGFSGGKGTVDFANTNGSQTINAAVGPNITTHFSGRNVTFGQEQGNTAFFFNSKDPMTAAFGNTDLANANFTVTPDTGVKHTVAFSRDGVILDGNLGGNKPIIFEANNNNFGVSAFQNSKGAHFRAKVANKTTMSLQAAGNKTVTIASVGTFAKPFGTLVFNSDGHILGDTWSTGINIVGKQVATFDGAVNGPAELANSQIRFQGAGATANFNHEGLVLRSNLVNTKDKVNAGIANFGDINATIHGLIGTEGDQLEQVNFNHAANSAKKTTLMNDIHGAVINFNNGTYVAGSPTVRLCGQSTFNNATLDLGLNHFQSEMGDAVFGGNIVIRTTSDGTTGMGGTFINRTGNLIFSKGSSLDIQVNDLTKGVPRENLSIEVINQDVTGGTSDATRAILGAATTNLTQSSNQLASWSIQVDNQGNLKLVRANLTKQRFAEKLKSLGTTGNLRDMSETAGLIADAPANTDAGKFADDLATLFSTNESKFREAIERITGTIEGSINQSTEQTGTTLMNRLQAVAPAPSSLGDQISPESISVGYDDTTTGLSAGDDHERHGVWASPFFANSDQKSRKGAPGYKDDSFGLSAGFDTKVNDDMILGAAGTYASSDMKHRDTKRGDKTKVDSYMFSIYGMQQLTTNWFVLGSGTVGTNHVRNSSIRVVSTGNQVAKGKYSSMSFAGELLAGYHYMMNAMSVTPMAGVRYSRVNDGGYKESGTANQNLDINKKASNKFDVIAGLRVTCTGYDMEGVTITPEVHGFVHHDLINKNPDVDVRMNGVAANLVETSAKPTRTFFNVGVGASARYGMMEYGATYDAHLASKFTGHQGTLKIRVNF